MIFLILGLGGQMTNALLTNTSSGSSHQSPPSMSQANLLNLAANLNSSGASNSSSSSSVGGGSSTSSSSSQQAGSSNSAPIQNQLIESFRTAVTLGLIPADLLNTKLPQDVLTLLYQLFQTLQHYSNSLARIQTLQRRRAQMNPAQYKSEMDMLQQESQAYKDNLTIFQSKINAAHMIIKQQQQSAPVNQNKSVGAGFPSGSSGASGSQTPPVQLGNLSNGPLGSGGSGVDVSTALLSAASAAGVPLSDLPILKEQSAAQRSKLIQLLQEQQQQQQLAAAAAAAAAQQSKMGGMGQRQQSSQQKQNSYFGTGSGGSNNSSGFTTPTGAGGGMGQWSNFGMMDPVDDRITPFIPGQPWAGQPGQSIEDDPNCTPGSVSKPLLHETIDPESILTSLQRAGSSGSSQWPNSLDFGFSSLSISNSMCLN